MLSSGGERPTNLEHPHRRDEKEERRNLGRPSGDHIFSLARRRAPVGYGLSRWVDESLLYPEGRQTAVLLPVRAREEDKQRCAASDPSCEGSDERDGSQGEMCSPPDLLDNSHCLC